MASDTTGNSIILEEVARLSDQLMATPHNGEMRSIDRLRLAIGEARAANLLAVGQEKQEDLFGSGLTPRTGGQHGTA